VYRLQSGCAWCQQNPWEILSLTCQSFLGWTGASKFVKLTLMQFTQSLCAVGQAVCLVHAW
jgi:hypothetical protein